MPFNNNSVKHDFTGVFRSFVKGHTLNDQKKNRIEEKSDNDELESIENSSEEDIDEIIEEGSLDSEEKLSLLKDSVHKLKIPAQKPRG